MLGDEHVGIAARTSAGLLYRRENVDLFKFLFVILLAESAKQFGSLLQWLRRHLASAAQLHRTLMIDQQGAADDAMLAHQVFGCRYLRLDVSVLFFNFVRWARTTLVAAD